MIFQDPSFLQFGVGVTAFILIGLLGHARRRRRLAVFMGGRRAVARISRSDLYRAPIERAILLGLAGLALSFAAAGPTWIDAPEPGPPVKRVMIAIDVSASMQAADISPTRLARAVGVADELIAGLEGHRVGLLLFAGTGYALAPPTHDHDALRFLLGGVTPTIASALDPGTLISVGITEAVELLQREDRLESSEPAGFFATGSTDGEIRGERVIILIGDGESGENDEAVSEALAMAREADISVHAIGVGTETGGGMIMPAGTYQLGGPVVNAAGERGMSRLREPFLRDVAAMGGGRYANADFQAQIQGLGAELLDLGLSPETSPDEGLPIWLRYDIAFVLGLLALMLIVLESVLHVLSPGYWLHGRSGTT